MATGFKGVCGVLIASSLFVSSTGAVAAANSAPLVAPVSATQINPWAALSAMSGGASAAALCGAAAVAATAQTPGGCVLPVLDTAPVAGPPQPIPVPPVEGPSGLGLGVDPLLLALGVLAAGVLVYFLVRNHHHANSPA
jgi:hypothetical protein